MEMHQHFIQKWRKEVLLRPVTSTGLRPDGKAEPVSPVSSSPVRVPAQLQPLTSPHIIYKQHWNRTHLDSTVLYTQRVTTAALMKFYGYNRNSENTLKKYNSKKGKDKDTLKVSLRKECNVVHV